MGILFDLDGTLWDVSNITYKTVNEITKKYNLNEVSKEQIKNGFGKNSKECSKVYFPNLEENMAISLLKESSSLKHQKLKLVGGTIYDGLEDVLKKLNKKYKLFIISNTSHIEYIESFLISSNLGKYFEDYIASGSINYSKGEAIEDIIRNYNLKKAVYVGDTIGDMEASKYAGIDFIHAKYGFGNCNAIYNINCITELPDLVDTIFN